MNIRRKIMNNTIILLWNNPTPQFMLKAACTNVSNTLLEHETLTLTSEDIIVSFTCVIFNLRQTGSTKLVKK